MTATVSEVEDAVVAQLKAFTNLRGWSYLPDNFTPPCAVVGVDEITYHGSFTGMGGSDVPHVVTILVIVARPSERSGQNAIDDYRSYSGEKSVRAALETDQTLGGVVQTSVVQKSSPHMAITIGGVDYLACQFTAEVHA